MEDCKVVKGDGAKSLENCGKLKNWTKFAKKRVGKINLYELQ
jgi:hypothetical protein